MPQTSAPRLRSAARNLPNGRRHQSPVSRTSRPAPHPKDEAPAAAFYFFVATLVMALVFLLTIAVIG